MPAYSWIPPGMPGHQPDLGKEYGFNPTWAKQVLAAAGYPNGQGLPPITLSYGMRGYGPQVAPFLQEQWKQNLGVDVTLEPMEPKAYNQFMNKLQHQVGLLGWGADYPDPDNWLPELFGTGAGNNKTAYSNPALEQLMKFAGAETDADRRLRMWNDVQKVVVDDAPMAFMYHQVAYRLVKPWVKAVYFNGMDFLGAPGGRSYFQTWISKKQ
ncbi:MAG: ABC transporter substrate-binding protein [Actinobacteria bacterium]|nr:ABC transporter substrate-binding protein [Actinomycetota bacterium]